MAGLVCLDDDAAPDLWSGILPPDHYCAPCFTSSKWLVLLCHFPTGLSIRDSFFHFCAFLDFILVLAIDIRRLFLPLTILFRQMCSDAWVSIRDVADGWRLEFLGLDYQNCRFGFTFLVVFGSSFWSWFACWPASPTELHTDVSWDPWGICVISTMLGLLSF